MPPRVKSGPDGCYIMEYDVSTDTTHIMKLRFLLKPYGFWRKIGYVLGLVNSKDVLAEIELINPHNNLGNISNIEMYRYKRFLHTEYRGFCRVVAGNGVLRIMVDESVEKGDWYWSVEFVTLFN